MVVTGTRLRLRVVPGADRSGLVGRHGEGWKVRVAAPPERGRANDALLRVLAAALSVPVQSLTLVAGRASRDKVVQLAGLDEAEAVRRLEAAS